MNAPERNYEIYDKEFMAIVQALEDWCYYLEGLSRRQQLNVYTKLK